MAAAVVLASVVLPTGPAGASTPVTIPLPADSVNLLDGGVDVALTQPADGRLRGNGLQAVVTGYAFRRHASRGIALARGQEELELPLSDAFLGQTTIPPGNGPLAGARIDPVNGALDIDGRLVPLPAPQTDDGTAPVNYLASVPAAAKDVALQLTQDGFTQTFSFTKGAREGVQPPVLYRDPAVSQPYEKLGQTQTIATPDPQDNLPAAALPITINDVYLTWYAPQAASTHPALDQAYLTFEGTAQAGGTAGNVLPGTYLNYLNPLNAAQVTLTLPDCQTLTSTLTPDKTIDETGAGLFSGDYSFTVPWDLTKATLNFTIAALQVEDSYLPQGTTTLPIDKTVTFPVDLPAPTPPPRATPSPSPSPAAVTTSAPYQHSSDNAWWLILLAAAALLIAGAGWTLRRQRSRRQPTTEPQAAPARPEKPAGTNAETIATAPSRANATRSLGVSLDPPPPPPGVPEFEILGDVLAAEWPSDTPPSGPLLELGTFLACNPERGYTAEELRDHLSADPDDPLGRDSIRTYAGAFRRQVGPHHFPDGGRSGYRLNGIRTDWHRFQDFVCAADSSVDPVTTAQNLAWALSLVRGVPLRPGANVSFRWADTELRSTIEVAVTDTAARLSEIALDHDDLSLATWAASQGLLAERHSIRLNALALTSANRTGDPDRLAQAWKDLSRRFSPEPVPDELVALYESFRSDRPSAAPA